MFTAITYECMCCNLQQVESRVCVPVFTPVVGADRGCAVDIYDLSIRSFTSTYPYATMHSILNYLLLIPQPWHIPHNTMLSLESSTATR